MPGWTSLLLASLDALNPGQADCRHKKATENPDGLDRCRVVKPMGAQSDRHAQTPIIPSRLLMRTGSPPIFFAHGEHRFCAQDGARVIEPELGIGDKERVLSEAFFESASTQRSDHVASAGNDPTGNRNIPAAYPGSHRSRSSPRTGSVGKIQSWGFRGPLCAGVCHAACRLQGRPGSMRHLHFSGFYREPDCRHPSKNPKATKQEILDALRKKP